ncbi:hypothetical protein [Petrimonas sulfuriphila]|uniref:hypothetical protein n=1 Tax=Petrimonas sulfuriphila TaxID=285070 RepID=UPI003EBA7B0D
MKTEPTINIQSEVVKIHSQFGMTEIANYRIEKLFEMYVKQSSPKIKQLEWKENGSDLIAETPFGEIKISTIDECFNEYTISAYFMSGLIEVESNYIDEAKRVCQEDYERRVKECLE